MLSYKYWKRNLKQKEDINFNNITKEHFKEYESVRKSGSYNMYDWRARYLTSLTRKQWLTIIKHYNKIKLRMED